MRMISSPTHDTDALPYASAGIVLQIPKELFKKTWGITETLGQPRKTAMYLVSLYLSAQWSRALARQASAALARFSAT